MKAFQFNPTNGDICCICGTNDVRDTTGIPTNGTGALVQVHVDCLVEGLMLYPGSKNSVIGKEAPFYTTEAVEFVELKSNM